MTTAPVVAVVAGSTFSVDVTLANLDIDITIRDFIVLIGGALAPTQSSFNKLTGTSLGYSGVALPGGTTIEVRRNTPRDVRVIVLPNTKVRATDWNKEFDRRVRIQEEVDLYGAGGGFTVRLPDNTPYGLAWSTDTLFSPTRQALYNKLETTVSSVSPALTGFPTSTTASTSDNSTRIATTAYVKNNIITLAPLASPSFTGVPTVPTVSTGDNSTSVASTAYVKSNLLSYAPLNSPSFTGTPTSSTLADGTKTTAVVNALTMQRQCRPVVIARQASSLTLTAFVWQDIPFNTEVNDTSGAFSTPFFTAPFTGIYMISGLVALDASTGVLLSVGVSTGTELLRLGSGFGSTAGLVSASGCHLMPLTAGASIKFFVFSFSNTTTVADTGRNSCHMSICYMGIDTAS